MSSSAPAGSGPNDKNEEESPYMPSQDTITALGSGSWAELMMKQERPRMPVDRLINQTMQQAKAKNMNKLARSYRYRVEGAYSSEAEANLWLAAAARADKARLESQFDTTLTEVCADALAVVGRAEPWANWTLAIGVQCHRHWSGFEPESVPYEGDRGDGKATVGQEQRMYYYTPAPMLRRRGARMEGGSGDPRIYSGHTRTRQTGYHRCYRDFCTRLQWETGPWLGTWPLWSAGQWWRRGSAWCRGGKTTL